MQLQQLFLTEKLLPILTGKNNMVITANNSPKRCYHNYYGKWKGILFLGGKAFPTQSTNKPEDSYLEVRKVYRDRYGKPFNNAFYQNDLVVVKSTYESTNGITIPNLSNYRLLPAGFEIENAKLQIPQLEWLKTRQHRIIKDIRDVG